MCEIHTILKTPLTQADGLRRKTKYKSVILAETFPMYKTCYENKCRGKQNINWKQSTNENKAIRSQNHTSMLQMYIVARETPRTREGS